MALAQDPDQVLLASGPERHRLQDEPTIIFVLGTVRSGSTLLARLLDGLPGVATLGEALNTWRALLVDDDCSCGKPASACRVWADVTRLLAQRSSGGVLPELLARAESLRSLDLLSRVPTQRSPQRQALVRQWRELYLAFARSAGVSTIVDTSKTPASLVVALETGLPVKVVHLVRDPRAVAFSEFSRGAREGRRGVARSSFGWCLTHVLADRHPAIPAHHHLRYEDLMRDPWGTLQALSASTGLPDQWPPLSAETPGRLTLPEGSPHDLAGNRVRKQSEILLRLDDEWQQRMPRQTRWLIAASTAPVRRRFGYRTRY